MKKARSGTRKIAATPHPRHSRGATTRKPSKAVDPKSNGSSASSIASLDDLGTLPRSYGTDTIFLVAQDPHWLFTYWDIDITRHPGGKTLLRVYDLEDTVKKEIEVPFEMRNWYIPIEAADTDYIVEIGYLRGSAWKPLARSNVVHTPRDKISGSAKFDFATLPMHISFQKLLENVQNTIDSEEALIQALGRMQNAGKLLAFGAGLHAMVDADERIVLEALLGKEVVDEILKEPLSAEELNQRIRSHLEKRLNSAAPWNAAVLSSWLAFEQASWAAAATSSWGSAPQSWPQPLLSSWGHAETSSWGGSENISSFGFAKREFFLHANAEVTFYGGTHPQAKVTIDGKPINLNPDGTFDYHFIFPDGKYEIPVVATSPDGVETRSVTLTFERTTIRVGNVGNTRQVPHPTPLGAKSF